MSLEAELIESFQLFGTIEGKTLEKCVELCGAYSVSAEDLADQWAAYSTNNLNGEGPSARALEAMEKKEFGKHSNKDYSLSKKAILTPTSVRVYKSDLQDLDTDDLVVNSYSTPKSVKQTNKRIRSPDEDSTKKPLQPNCLNFSPKMDFSPSTYSPATTTQSSNYADRSDSGATMLRHGQGNLLNKATFKRDDLDQRLIPVKLWAELSGQIMRADTRYMYEVMNAKAASLNGITEWLGRGLIKKYKLDDPQPYIRSSGSVTTYGRICCDANGKLNAASVLLESTQELGRGSSVQLNLNKVSNYAIFPGQVVAVQGFNPTGNCFIAQKLYTDSSSGLPLPSENPATFTGPLQIVVAAGPFTLRNNLSYQPLQDLIKYVTNRLPHILILIGPFIDIEHENICDGGSMAETFDSFFENLISGIMTPLEGSNIQVVLLPSQKDAHHHIVFPTPPLTLIKKYPNLHCVADPNLLNLQGLLIGVTSVDILMHLGKEEVCSGPQSGDRMSRLASHLLGQQCFYPLYPPDEDVCVDHELLDQYGTMDVIPHILIIPSNLRYFIKNVNGCIIINPDRLSKGYVAGTFARIQVYPPTNKEVRADSIVAEIVRV